MQHDPFNRSRLPGDFSREGKVRLLGEAFRALMDGRLPSREAALFLGSAGMAWLEGGGSLERDFLRVVKPKSRHTPAYLWHLSQAESHPDERRDPEE